MNKHCASGSKVFNCAMLQRNKLYRTHAIITCDLYNFYPSFQEHFFVFKDVFWTISDLMYGQYSRVVCNQEQFMMAPVQQIIIVYFLKSSRLIFRAYIRGPMPTLKFSLEMIQPRCDKAESHQKLSAQTQGAIQKLSGQDEVGRWSVKCP